MAKAYLNDDTIVAIATSPNASTAIGIVRISGTAALEIARETLYPSSKKGTFWQDLESHKLYRAELHFRGKIIDDGLFVFMRGPHSYTGEDQVEVQMHGNPRLLQLACTAFISTGKARLAEPGEFSFRAFRNGRLDLSQAEAVADLISAPSPIAAEKALDILLGNTRRFIDEKKTELVRLLAEVEVDIDFSDQGVSIINYKSWARALEGWVTEIEKVRAEFLRAQPLRDGIRLALVGEPNVGKSTLFNSLLQEDRSIVSDIAGTTRDVVREQFFLGGLLIRLSDTAGIRHTVDSIEHQGIARTMGEIAGAHIILLVLDATALDSEADFLKKVSDFSALTTTQNPRAHKIILLNKMDLLSARLPFDLYRACPDIPVICLSALKGTGREELEGLIMGFFAAPKEEIPGYLGRMRHHGLLGSAVMAVNAAIAKVERGENMPDLLASDLRQALSFLGEISGEVNTDDVLRLIFSEFCIGK